MQHGETMSLSISLYENNSEIASMNWLRNPFGLERWAEGNFKYATKGFAIPVTLSASLWDVCNKWSYDDSSNVDRPLFKFVVDIYNSVIQKLEIGYYWFGVSEFMQFVLPHVDVLPAAPFGGDCYRIKGNIFYADKVGIPQEYWVHIWPKNEVRLCKLGHYKMWFTELVEFAELLQDPAYVFYCSN